MFSAVEQVVDRGGLEMPEARTLKARRRAAFVERLLALGAESEQLVMQKHASVRARRRASSTQSPGPGTLTAPGRDSARTDASRSASVPQAERSCAAAGASSVPQERSLTCMLWGAWSSPSNSEALCRLLRCHRGPPMQQQRGRGRCIEPNTGSIRGEDWTG
jgi:hypothetical protein